MSHEEGWAQRLEALVAMGTRLKASAASIPSSPSSPAAPSDAALSQGLLNAYVDLSLERLPDVHQRVSVEALSVLQLCIEGHAGTPALKAKLGPVLVALFHRPGRQAVAHTRARQHVAQLGAARVCPRCRRGGAQSPHPRPS
jgi:hypothetical protein